jgi:hypothetical protein
MGRKKSPAKGEAHKMIPMPSPVNPARLGDPARNR